LTEKVYGKVACRGLWAEAMVPVKYICEFSVETPDKIESDRLLNDSSSRPMRNALLKKKNLPSVISKFSSFLSGASKSVVESIKTLKVKYHKIK
jgi:hypothetical protein